MAGLQSGGRGPARSIAVGSLPLLICRRGQKHRALKCVNGSTRQLDTEASLECVVRDAASSAQTKAGGTEGTVRLTMAGGLIHVTLAAITVGRERDVDQPARHS